jgi:hypothetical protein
MSKLSLDFKLDSMICEDCNTELWIGAEACPVCGASLQPGTQSDAHLYRARIATFEPLLHRSREPVPTSVVPVTDWQYLRYMQDTDLLDQTALTEITEAANALMLKRLV